MKLNDEQLVQLRDEGWIFMPDYFSEEEVAVLKAEARKVFQLKQAELLSVEKTHDGPGRLVYTEIPGVSAARFQSLVEQAVFLVEHRFDGFVVVCERLADAGRQARIFDKLAQALTRQVEMRGAAVAAGISRRICLAACPGPGPSGQPGEHPLQYAH